MFRGSIVLRVIAWLLLVALLVGVGYVIFNAGQAQGYAMGLAASGKAVQPPTSPAVPYYPGYGWGFGRPFFFPFFPLFGFLFFGGLIFLFFFVIGGLFRRAYWRRGPGGWYGPWQGGPGGPEGQGQPESGQRPPEK